MLDLVLSALLYIYLAASVVLFAILLNRGLWWRYKFFALMLIADLVKYAAWSFGNPDIYVIFDPIALAFRVLACIEVVIGSTEFISSEGRRSLIALVLAVAALGCGITLGANVRESDIKVYNHTRLIIHCSSGLAVLIFLVWSRILRVTEAFPLDKWQIGFLAALCLAYGVADVITLSERDYDVWQAKVVGFRAVRVGLYGGWVWRFWR